MKTKVAHYPLSARATVAAVPEMASPIEIAAGVFIVPPSLR